MRKNDDSNNWRWMPAIIIGGLFIFSAFFAVLVAYRMDDATAKYLTAFASFFSNVATPFVTVGSVWVAYWQLKSAQDQQIVERQINDEKVRLNYYCFMAKNAYKTALDIEKNQS